MVNITTRKGKGKNARKHWLYLDYSHNGIRKVKSVGQFIYKPAQSPEEKQHNQKAQQIAKLERNKTEDELIYDKHNIMPQHFKSLRISSYLEKLIDIKANIEKLEAGTVETYRQTLNIIRSSNVNFPVIHLTAQNAKAVQHYIRKTYASHSLKLSHISQAISLAVEDGIIETNPFKQIRSSSGKGKKKEKEKIYHSLDEIRMLLATPPTPGPRYWLVRMYLFCCFTSFRFSDAIRIAPNHIKRDKGIISIKQKKTGEWQHAPLSGIALNLLYTWPNQKAHEPYFWDVILRSNKHYKKGTNNEKAYTYVAGNASYHIRMHCKQAGIAEDRLSAIHFHTSRDTYINAMQELMEQSGKAIDMKQISSSAGHKNLNTTLKNYDVYTGNAALLGGIIDEGFGG